MLILAFETANFGTSLALLEDETVLSEKVFPVSHGQATFLIPEIKALVEEAGFALRDVRLVVTTTGPGSFTGLRLSLATAQTFELAGHTIVMGIDSFTWHAGAYVQAHPELLSPFLVCLDTFRQDIFCRLFDEHGVALKDPCALMPEEIFDYAERAGVCVGNGTYLLPNEMKYLCNNTFKPLAKNLGILAFQHHKQGLEKKDYSSLSPVYLRAPHTTFSKLV